MSTITELRQIGRDAQAGNRKAIATLKRLAANIGVVGRHGGWIYEQSAVKGQPDYTITQGWANFGAMIENGEFGGRRYARRMALRSATVVDAEIEAYAEQAERKQAAVVHFRGRYERGIECGEQGRVLVTEVRRDTTCTDCERALTIRDFDRVYGDVHDDLKSHPAIVAAYALRDIGTRAAVVALHDAIEAAERPAITPRQFCRKGLHSCVPAVTLTFDGGARRLHWCAEHADDAEQYRGSADDDAAEQDARTDRNVGPYAQQFDRWVAEHGKAHTPAARMRDTEEQAYAEDAARGFRAEPRQIAGTLCLRTDQAHMPHMIAVTPECRDEQPAPEVIRVLRDLLPVATDQPEQFHAWADRHGVDLTDVDGAAVLAAYRHDIDDATVEHWQRYGVAVGDLVTLTDPEGLGVNTDAVWRVGTVFAVGTVRAYAEMSRVEFPSVWTAAHFSRLAPVSDRAQAAAAIRRARDYAGRPAGGELYPGGYPGGSTPGMTTPGMTTAGGGTSPYRTTGGGKSDLVEQIAAGNLSAFSFEPKTTAHLPAALVDRQAAAYAYGATDGAECGQMFSSEGRVVYCARPPHGDDAVGHSGLRFPEGTPEHAAYTAEMKVELGKFARGDAPYEYDRDAINGRGSVPPAPADVDDDAAWAEYVAALPQPTDDEIAAVVAEYAPPADH